jgi:S-adenosylmethionine hydrolase
MTDGTAPLPIITLTTDFGLSDYYVGAMKGVVLSVNPAARIIDITHDIPPRQVEQAAFISGAAWPYFPPGCVHVAVVDPGVGTSRRALALQTPWGWFVGPDNGVLSAALPEMPVATALSPCRRIVAVAIEESLRAARSVQPFTAASLTSRAHLTLGVSIQ